ncbi:MAG: DEAD/DEAH box helicase family protein, partial [Candidatus Nanopelagicales bacterium]
MAAVEASWLMGVRAPAVVVPTGGGKGHPLDTEVPTPDGLRLWGDLAVGDQVFGADGRPTRVTAVYDRGLLPVFKVTMKHGESVLVDGEHLWQVKRKGRLARVVDTRWLMSQPLKDRDGWCWSIPVAEPIVRPQVSLPLHPYVVGALIANGGMTHDGTILTTPDETVAHLVAEHTMVTRCQVDESRYCPRFSLPGLTGVTRSLGMRVHSRDKRIPRAYLEASADQRLDLLHGLMDADGSVRQPDAKAPGRRSVAYHTTSSGLAADVAELVSSLGGTCSVAVAERVARPTEYTCSILLPIGVEAMRSGRKVARGAPRRAFAPRSAIVGIEPAGVAPVRCITVEAPDSLYLVTRNHIVTHNTVIFAHLIAGHLERRGGRVLVLAHRGELLDQAARRIKDVAPDLRVGVVMAEADETDADVIVGSVQTLRLERRRERLDDVSLIVTDECHHATADSYRAVYAHWPDALMLGVTATMERADGDALGQVWDEIAYRIGIVDLIAQGHLADVKGIRITVPDLD